MRVSRDTPRPGRGRRASFEMVLLVGFAVPLWGRVVDDFPSEGESTIVRVVATVRVGLHLSGPTANSDART
jgi:hypothetical protein